MLPYIILLFLITILLAFGSLNKQVKGYTFFLAIILLILFSGLGSGVGFDYFNYLELFDQVKLNYSVPLEVGYVAIIKTVIFFSGKYQLLLLISSLITNLLIGNFIYKNSSNPNLSLFIYLTLSIYYLATFTTIRQFIAVGIFAISIKFISARNIWLYTLLIAIGSSIHITVLILWPLYFVLHRKYKLYQYALALVLYIVGINIVTVIFKDVLGFAHYFAKTDSNSNNIVFVLFSLIGTSLIFYKDKLIEIKQEATLYLNLIFLSILVIITIYISPIPSEIALRMSTYFNLAYLIIIPIFLMTIKNSTLRYSCLVLVLLFFVSYFLYVTAINGVKYQLVPYSINSNLFSL